MPDSWQPQFVFAACQHGAEAALKRELAGARAGAAARVFAAGVRHVQAPGAVRASPRSSAAVGVRAHLRLLARLGRRATTCASSPSAAWALPDVAAVLAACDVAGLHVWQRDAAAPGERGFEPGATPLAAEAEAALREASPIESLRDPAQRPRQRRAIAGCSTSRSSSRASGSSAATARPVARRAGPAACRRWSCPSTPSRAHT